MSVPDRIGRETLDGDRIADSSRDSMAALVDDTAVDRRRPGGDLAVAVQLPARRRRLRQALPRPDADLLQGQRVDLAGDVSTRSGAGRRYRPRRRRTGLPRAAGHESQPEG